MKKQTNAIPVPAKKEIKKEVKKEEAKKKGKKDDKNQGKQPFVKKKVKKFEYKAPINKVKLTQIQKEIDNNYFEDQSSFIHDLTKQFEMCLKQKGEVIDIPIFKMNQAQREDFMESVRKAFVRAMRGYNQSLIQLLEGLTLGFNLGKQKINFRKFWNEVKFFKMNKIFNPLEIKKEEFFKTKILKPEEDVDEFGNKGQFKLNNQFRVCIITANQDLEAIKQELEVPIYLFNFFQVVL